MESPVSVLRSISQTLGCPYDGIEGWLGEFYGEPFPRDLQDKPDERLARIRKRMGVSEGRSITGYASVIKTETTRTFVAK